MKTFTNINQVKEYYFPENVKKEREGKFIKTATPAEIGKYWAEQSIKKILSEL